MNRVPMEKIISGFYDFVDCECNGQVEDMSMNAELEEMLVLAVQVSVPKAEEHKSAVEDAPRVIHGVLGVSPSKMRFG